MQVRGTQRGRPGRGAGRRARRVGWSALIPPYRFTLNGRRPSSTPRCWRSRASALLEHFAAHPAVGYLVARNVAAVVGQRLQVFQAMWLREMQRVVELSQA